MIGAIEHDTDGPPGRAGHDLEQMLTRDFDDLRGNPQPLQSATQPVEEAQVFELLIEARAFRLDPLPPFHLMAQLTVAETELLIGLPYPAVSMYETSALQADQAQGDDEHGHQAPPPVRRDHGETDRCGLGIVEVAVDGPHLEGVLA